jgi:FkbM family methyltransferase
MAKWGALVERATKRDYTKPIFSTKFPRVLQRMAALAGEVGTIIDVGASNGSWSDSVRPCWPNANYLLVEAQEVHAAALRHYATINSNVTIENSAASDTTGKLYFLENGPLGGSASHEPFPEGNIELPCISLDDSIANHQLPGPYLIKLDTHGHEREIFIGAEHALRNTALIVVEAYTFANFGRMRFWELCDHLADRGFTPAGISDPTYRPSDDLLWQMDMWFLPSTHRSFTDTTWNSTGAAAF